MGSRAAEKGKKGGPPRSGKKATVRRSGAGEVGPKRVGKTLENQGRAGTILTSWVGKGGQTLLKVGSYHRLGLTGKIRGETLIFTRPSGAKGTGESKP